MNGTSLGGKIKPALVKTFMVTSNLKEIWGVVNKLKDITRKQKQIQNMGCSIGYLIQLSVSLRKIKRREDSKRNQASPKVLYIIVFYRTKIGKTNL